MGDLLGLQVEVQETRTRYFNFVQARYVSKMLRQVIGYLREVIMDHLKTWDDNINFQEFICTK